MQKQLSGIDDAIAYQVGGIIIKLTWVNHGVYTVKVHDGVNEVHGLGGTYDNETEARLIARGYAEMYKAEYEAKVTNLDAFKQTYRPVRNTRTHVFRRPLSEPQTRAVKAQRNGRIHLGDGVTRPMLRAIADKGYGNLNYETGRGKRKVVESLDLNQAGFDLLADQPIAA